MIGALPIIIIIFLQHISAPLMNFEVVKLIQQFPKEDAPPQEKPEEGDGGGTLIDYRCCLNACSIAVLHHVLLILQLAGRYDNSDCRTTTTKLN